MKLAESYTKDSQKHMVKTLSDKKNNLRMMLKSMCCCTTSTHSQISDAPRVPKTREADPNPTQTRGATPKPDLNPTFDTRVHFQFPKLG